MTIKSDIWLRRMAEEQSMITPFLPSLVRAANGSRIISAGCSSYGYDMRLADDGFRIFSSVHAKEIDPKRFEEQYSLIAPELHDSNDGSRYYLLPPHHYGLGVTVETFKMPRNVTGVALGKSTYARAGLLVNTTPLEAGDRKSTRLNSSHANISYAVFCLKKKKTERTHATTQTKQSR